MSDQINYSSRRQRREAEQLASMAINQASPNQSQVPYTPATSVPETYSSASYRPESYSPEPNSLSTNTPEPDIFIQPVKPADFSSTVNLGAEPVTASIIINTVPDLSDSQIIISNNGGLVRTGSIELPTVDPTTGSIMIINHGQEADEALNEDSLNSFVSSVAPLRAAGIAKNRSKVVELTLVNRKGQGQVYAVMSTAVLMITVGAFVVAAFMLGIFG